MDGDADGQGEQTFLEGLREADWLQVRPQKEEWATMNWRREAW